MFGVAGLGLFRSFRGLGFKSSRRFKHILREGGLGVKAWNCSRIFGLGFALKFGGLGVPVAAVYHEHNLHRGQCLYLLFVVFSRPLDAAMLAGTLFTCIKCIVFTISGS